MTTNAIAATPKSTSVSKVWMGGKAFGRFGEALAEAGFRDVSPPGDKPKAGNGVLRYERNIGRDESHDDALRIVAVPTDAPASGKKKTGSESGYTISFKLEMGKVPQSLLEFANIYPEKEHSSVDIHMCGIEYKAQLIPFPLNAGDLRAVYPAMDKVPDEPIGRMLQTKGSGEGCVSQIAEIKFSAIEPQQYVSVMIEAGRAVAELRHLTGLQQTFEVHDALRALKAADNKRFPKEAKEAMDSLEGKLQDIIGTDLGTLDSMLIVKILNLIADKTG